jgi:CheY-like chemotaxis protein
MLLPKLGGREVMLALRVDPSTARIPVIFFSSLSQANELKLANEGAAGYFSKSRLAENPAVGEKELIQLIEAIVQKSRKGSQPEKLKSSRAAVAGAD